MNLETEIELSTVLNLLKKHSNPKIILSQKRFGIDASKSLGVSIPDLRLIAKSYKKNHALALKLWNSNIHEAKLLATIIDDPKQVTQAQVEKWINDLYSWDLCDGLCGNLLVNIDWVYNNLEIYLNSSHEFIKRTGFVLMAYSAVRHKKASSLDLEKFYPLILKYGNDERNFVKKAVSWALRQIGKRNKELKISALKIANELLNQNTKSTIWIAKDVTKELETKFN